MHAIVLPQMNLGFIDREGFGDEAKTAVS